MRGATAVIHPDADSARVSIHAPHAGRDTRRSRATPGRRSFNPRAPCGARLIETFDRASYQRFQSTRPMRGATIRIVTLTDAAMFQSTRPMRGATCGRCLSCRFRRVSIHAPHAGRDVLIVCLDLLFRVSIHAPHAGRDSKRGHDFPPLPRIYGYSPPQIRFSRHLRPTPLLRHDSRTYIFTFCFLFTSPSHSVMNTQMMIAASKS